MDFYRVNKIKKLQKGLKSDQNEQFDLKCPDLPLEIYGMEQQEIYEFLDASPRNFAEFIYYTKWIPLRLFSKVKNPDADIVHKFTEDEFGRYHKITTPFGILTESWKHGSTYPYERILKTRDDIRAVIYYLKERNIGWEFNQDNYNVFLNMNDKLGNRCSKTTSPWRNPYNKCLVELGGIKATMLLMKRYPIEFNNLCEEINRINFEIIMPVILKSPMEYISLGDNIDYRNNPPYVYEKYQVPYYERMAEICKKAGKFVYAHFDGYLKKLLPYLEKEIYPLDGIEAPTFSPQGDVTLEEFKNVWDEEKIILDGIPSTLFLPHFSESRFISYVEKVLEEFSPNIILGVSDEFSPNGLFKRLQMVAGIVENFVP
jgi:hypothetical protein